MRHKCTCPLCGELKYLHGKETPGNIIVWLCDDCDKPIKVRVIDMRNLLVD